ncbi:PREDICTED: N-acylneuraminate cytidylyltransferase-like [Branchiostoma belcheri]|uniref:N-acylneuraminate cytidylyltransferase n=1 Tax=Branchiostoma belcheri TaxID=7741 RepID=A0A6P4XV44_BRABE|nr:PREDICTED: N-acylneuraminate cytidylyltransferase-like [Branchiostoma belcheri]
MSSYNGPLRKKARTSCEIQRLNMNSCVPNSRYEKMGFNPTPELRAEWRRRFGKEDPHVAVLMLARGGSKGIPMKNIKMLGDLELIGWGIRAALDSDVMDSVWVSTDHDDIAATARRCGAQVHMRGQQVSHDKCNSWTAIDEFVRNHPEVDIIVHIQATCPCVHPFHVQEGVRMMLQDGKDSVFSVYRRHQLRWSTPKYGMQTFPLNFDLYNRPMRQQWPGELIENGAFYIFTRDVEQQGVLQGGRMGCLVMDSEYSIDIDTDQDWQLAEQRLLRFGYHGRAPKKMKLVVVNIDGTLLDGQVQVSSTGEEFRSFKATDIAGIHMLQRNGIEFRVVAQGESQVQKELAKKLSLKLEENCTDKLEVIDSWRQELNIDWQNIGFMGCGIDDITCIKKAGMSGCPSDADTEVQKHSHVVSTYRGGQGALREFCEQLLLKCGVEPTLGPTNGATGNFPASTRVFQTEQIPSQPEIPS